MEPAARDDPPEPDPTTAATPEGAHDDAPSGGRVTRANRWVRTEQTRVNQTIDATRERLEAARPRSKWVDIGFRAWEHDTGAGGAVIAGAVAFRVFLFLIPYVFVVVVGVGFAGDAANEDASAAARDAGIGGLVAKAVGGAADLSGFERVSALVVGLLALFLGAKALLKVLRVSYGMIWSVRPSKLKKTTKPALALIGLTTVALATAALVGSLRHGSLVLAVIGYTLTTAVPFGLWMCASWWLPRRSLTWEELVPGALVVAVGAQALHLVTVLWIAHVLESKTDTYGAIGAALAILLWAYLLGRIITAAAVIDAALWLRRADDAIDQTGGDSTREGTP
ncbi:MAG: YhjD/YihY/BrkB family envelope integrity protein [Acidimicrobiia bacterium]